MGLFKLKPTRDHRVQDSELVADLDAILAKPVSFRWQGRVYTIEPLTLQQFTQLVQSFGEMDRLKQRDNSTMEDWAENYSKVFRIACPAIKKHDVEQMSQIQIGALFQLILDCISGRQQAEDEKKR